MSTPNFAGACATIDLEEDLGDGMPVKERLLCLVSDMMELASVEAMEEAEELALSFSDEFLRVESNEMRALLPFFFSKAVGSEEAAVCERKKVATLCGIL